jgi:uncharacterized membrane protein YhaH (DUF805 family)
MAGPMQVLRILFTPSARLRPQPFVLAAVAVYAAGLASQWLSRPDLFDGAGLWPYAVAQAALIWIWICVHANRLRDAGRPIGLAVAAGALYALSVVLLILLVMVGTSGLEGSNSNAGAFGLVTLFLILAAFLGAPHYGAVELVEAALIAAALVPIIVALAVTLWAAPRPSSEKT